MYKLMSLFVFLGILVLACQGHRQGHQVRPGRSRSNSKGSVSRETKIQSRNSGGRWRRNSDSGVHSSSSSDSGDSSSDSSDTNQPPVENFGPLCACSEFKIFTDLKTWDEASVECSQSGGMLAMVTDDEIQAAIETAIFANNLGDTNFWIGLSDTSKEGKFVWVDGTKQKKNKCFSNWAENAPHKKGYDEDCTEIDGETFEWNDIECTVGNGFICQYHAAECPVDCTACLNA
ncbi:salivary C-type lectin 1-like [Glandiceps talaboti]